MDDLENILTDLGFAYQKALQTLYSLRTDWHQYLLEKVGECLEVDFDEELPYQSKDR